MSLVFFFNDTATTEIYTLSLHDALPILLVQDPEVARTVLGLVDDPLGRLDGACAQQRVVDRDARGRPSLVDRKSTRLNSSHANISYAVFCLKKKTNIILLRFLT